MTEHQLPHKAIDLMDQAAARVRLRTGGAADEAALLRALGFTATEPEAQDDRMLAAVKALSCPNSSTASTRS